ncbi:filamentous hemagglutinin, partial [Sporobacter termitidis DSM 10068]
NQDWSAPGKATLNTALGGGLGALGGYLGGKAAETAGAYLDQWAHVKGGNQLPEYRPSLANNKVEGYNGNRERVYETVKGLGKSAETSAEGAGNVINPNEIRFSQSSVNGVYKITASMKANGWQGEPIDVVKMSDGILTSVDNTRVASAREAGIDVRANVHGYNDPLTPDQMSRFATKKGIPTTWGEAIKLRIDKQNSAFRNSFPAGSFDLPMFK